MRGSAGRAAGAGAVTSVKPPFQLRRVWGGINGVLFHQMLHGVDIQPPSSGTSKSMGHQHVLEPELRTTDGAKTFSRHLLTKAAERLRRGDYYCRRLGLHISWVGDLGGWWDETDFHETRDTGFLLVRLDELWPRAPRYKPLSVGVVLLDLVPAAMHQSDFSAGLWGLRYSAIGETGSGARQPNCHSGNTGHERKRPRTPATRRRSDPIEGKKFAENQPCHLPVKQEVVPFNRCADRARDQCTAQLPAMLAL
jgi:impB/mucB/samB family C-terminal domain